MKIFFSYSFGCRVNEAEKEEIDRQMTQAGFSFGMTDQSINIVNTCAVTAKAEREARQYIYQLKKKYPRSKIVVTGCAATYWKKKRVDKQLPIDLLVDNPEKEFLVKIITNRLLDQSPAGRGDQIMVGETNQITSKFLKSKRAMIKIQDGCQRFCSYCIVPYLRGSPKSFLIRDIIKKIRFLKNIQEVILTAINTEAFGYDTGETLIQLIDQVINKTSIPRISFGSIHPWSFDQKFLNYYKKILKKKRLINFFHIPLQSGSNKILSLMKRDYTMQEFAWKVREIKKINPYALVATDIIVGFLDENDKDFAKTYDFLEKNFIDKFHVFRFSNRTNTASFYMKKRLSETPFIAKIQRARALADLSKKKYQLFLQKLIDKKYSSSALFLDKLENGHQQALLDNQVAIWVKTSNNLTGKIKNIQVVKLGINNLFGKII